MSGRVLRVVSLREFNFSGLGQGTSATQCVAEQIDTSQARHATIGVRWHSGAIPTCASITVNCYPDGHTEEDPAQIFKGSSLITTPIDIDDGDSLPFFETVSLNADDMGAMVLIEVTGALGASGVTPFDPVLSIDLVLKDG